MPASKIQQIIKQLTTQANRCHVGIVSKKFKKFSIALLYTDKYKVVNPKLEAKRFEVG